MSPESGFKPINFMPVKKHLYNVQFTMDKTISLSAGETKHSVQVVFGCFHFH